jgi:hypothetical protein
MPASANVGTVVTPAPSVVVKNARGEALQGVTVTFAVAAGGGTVTGATQTTDASGFATVGSWTLGNTAGEQRLTATVAALPAVTFTVTGLGLAASQVTKVNDGQAGTTGQPLAQTIGVIVKDQFGNPVSGVPVTFAAQSGTVNPTPVNTNASGAANTTWTLGTSPGVQHATATAGALAAVTFTATASYPYAPCANVGTLTIGAAPIAGTLAATDCKFTVDNSPVDPYGLTIGATPAVAIRMQSTALDSYLLLYRGAYSDTVNILAENGDSSATTQTAYLRLLLGAGSYVATANAFSGTGAYTIEAQAWNGSVENCDQVFITPGITVNQSLTATDCNTAGDTRLSDDYVFKLRANERIDVTMTSTAIDARLEIRSLDGALQASDDNGGGGTNAHLVFTTSSERYFYIRATASSTGGSQGAYTLAVSTPPNPLLVGGGNPPALRQARSGPAGTATRAVKRTNGLQHRD